MTKSASSVCVCIVMSTFILNITSHHLFREESGLSDICTDNLILVSSEN
jgi:hypothetical protein